MQQLIQQASTATTAAILTAAAFAVAAVLLSISRAKSRRTEKAVQTSPRALAAAFFAGKISSYCESEDYDGGFEIFRAQSPGYFFFVACGPDSDKLVFRIKESEDNRTLDTLRYDFNDIHVYSLAATPSMKFNESQTRPADTYLSVMPEGRPELETFYIPVL